MAPAGKPASRGSPEGAADLVSDPEAVAGILGQLAHDMRTPVGALGLWLRELGRECATAGVAEDVLPMTENAVRALARLAEDMDELAGILRGKLTIQKRRVALRDVLADVSERLRPRAAAKGVEIRLDAGPKPTRVAGDPGRLDRAFDALLGSAVAAVSGGIVELVVREEGREALVSIRPSPVGPEGLPRLEDTLGARGRGGVVLSLALARHLLEAHAATVEPGMSDLRVRLPLANGA